MKWLDGKCQFSEEVPLHALRSVLMCAALSCWRGRKVSTGFFLTLPLGGYSRNAEPQQWLTLSAWKRGGGFRWGMEGVLEGFILVMVIGLLVWK